MPDFLIRNVSAPVAARIDELARQAGQSRQEFILNLLTIAAGDSPVDPGIIIGFVELKQSELGADYTCPDCHQPRGAKALYLGYTGDFRPFGPVCEFCAVTE